MKKFVCALLSVLMILGAVACTKTDVPVDDGKSQQPEVTIEKVPYEMERTGNPDTGFDWYVNISDASVVAVDVVKEAIEGTPVEPEAPEATTEPTPEPTEEPSTDRLYYIYSMDSEGLSLNLAQLYMFGIDVHDMYILMHDDGTAILSFGDGDTIEAEYDETAFRVDDESLDYEMDGDNIFINMGTEHAVFAPADVVDAELKTLSETVSPIVTTETEDESGCDCDDDTETIEEAEQELEPEPDPVFVDNTKYTFTFTGRKEGKTVVRLDYQKVENGEVVSYSKHEAFNVEVFIDDDGRQVVKMEEFAEDTNGGSPVELESVPFEIEKEENVSTGYSWSIDIEDGNVLSCGIEHPEVEANTSEDDAPVLGAPSPIMFVFSGLKEGSTLVNLNYTRAWEGEDDEFAIHETYKAVVTEVDGKLVVEMEQLDNVSIDDNGTEPTDVNEAVGNVIEGVSEVAGEAAENAAAENGND